MAHAQHYSTAFAEKEEPSSLWPISSGHDEQKACQRDRLFTMHFWLFSLPMPAFASGSL